MNSIQGPIRSALVKIGAGVLAITVLAPSLAVGQQFPTGPVNPTNLEQCIALTRQYSEIDRQIRRAHKDCDSRQPRGAPAAGVVCSLWGTRACLPIARQCEAAQRAKDQAFRACQAKVAAYKKSEETKKMAERKAREDQMRRAKEQQARRAHEQQQSREKASRQERERVAREREQANKEREQLRRRAQENAQRAIDRDRQRADMDAATRRQFDAAERRRAEQLRESERLRQREAFDDSKRRLVTGLPSSSAESSKDTASIGGHGAESASRLADDVFKPQRLLNDLKSIRNVLVGDQLTRGYEFAELGNRVAGASLHRNPFAEELASDSLGMAQDVHRGSLNSMDTAFHALDSPSSSPSGSPQPSARWSSAPPPPPSRYSGGNPFSDQPGVSEVTGGSGASRHPENSAASFLESGATKTPESKFGGVPRTQSASPVPAILGVAPKRQNSLSATTNPFADEFPSAGQQFAVGRSQALPSQSIGPMVSMRDTAGVDCHQAAKRHNELKEAVKKAEDRVRRDADNVAAQRALTADRAQLVSIVDWIGSNCGG